MDNVAKMGTAQVKEAATVKRRRSCSVSINTADRNEAMAVIEEALKAEDVSAFSFYSNATWYDYKADPTGRTRLAKPIINYSASYSINESTYDEFDSMCG